jgi:Uma2 family endonuclease
VDDKVRAWLDAGAAMVWVVNPNPKWRSVTVYRPPSSVKILTESDELSGEDVLPGFHRAVRDLFAP